MDPVQVKVPYRLRRWSSDGMERPALGLLLSCLCRSLAVSANLGVGIAAHGWKGAAVAERPEGWCREASHSWKY